MKLLLSITLILILNMGYAQVNTPTNPFNKLSVGFSAGHYFFDPGIMATVTTRYFNNGRFALRFSGGIRWSEFYFAENNIFARYSSVQVGMVCLITQQERVRIYSETGLNVVFPNPVFSDKKEIPGFYGSLGSDFFIYSMERFGITYFLELGITLNPARAEKLEGQPR